MEKEAQSMLEDNHALLPLTLQESENIRRDKPQKILPSRWHFKRKTVEDDSGGITKTPKARWVVQGHRDEQAAKLSATSYAPTPSMTTINLVLQAMVAMKQRVRAADFTAAFLQSRPIEREIYVSQPNEGVPGVEPNVLLKMMVEVYGSTSGPSSWRSTLVPVLKSLKYQQSTYDACVFILKPSDVVSTTEDPETLSEVDKEQLKHGHGEQLLPKTKVTKPPDQRQETYQPNEGLIVLLVDDMLECGGATHQQNMKQLCQQFKIGKHVYLDQPGGVLFNGRRLTQNKHGAIECSMADYVQSKLEPVTVPKRTKKSKEGTDSQGAVKDKVDDAEPLNESQRQMVKSITAKILWLARQGRPDVVGAAAFLSQVTPDELTMTHLKEASRVVQHLRQTKDLSYTIHPIEPMSMKLAVFADGSPGAKGDSRGQGGAMICITTHALHSGQSAPMTPVMWRSGKLDRVTASSLAAEALSLQAAIAMAEMVVDFFTELAHAKWSLQWPRQRLACWEAGFARDLSGMLLAHSSSHDHLQQSICVTDAKSLYDSLRQHVRGREPRLAVTVAELRQGLGLLNMSVRWIPHNLMLVDGFTKPFTKANLSPLLKFLKTGYFKITDEDSQLAARQSEREQLGYNKRFHTCEKDPSEEK
eukprot:4821320-Amphidinium_carterae.1